MKTKLRIGIDVGGTNTDAAILNGDTIIGSCKIATTKDVTSGVCASVSEVLSTTGSSADQIGAVMVGTTHFLNALVQRKGLSRTGTLRLCGPTGRALPPMVDWPEDLKAVVDAGFALEDGGVEFDGRQITPINETAIRTQCRKWRNDSVTAVAVSSVFSLVDAEDELHAATIISEEIPNATISLSHQIGQNGLLQRESATILNGCLQALATDTVDALRRAFSELNLQSNLYLTQNDGTLMSADYAVRFPVHTIASGPTNSMRGAAFLTRLSDAAVVDIGGTTTDIGIISAGFPRVKSTGATIAGVRTNFRAPDVLSLGLGGGSKVKQHPQIEIGPESVGYKLTEEAKCFGGNTLTATDLMVASGRANVGSVSLQNKFDKAFLDQARSLIDTQIASTIDRMKLSVDPIPAILVGGGSLLVSGPLEGVSETIVPPHAGAANAIGAAIAQVSGESDRIVSLENTSREKALSDAHDVAIAKAVAAGANPQTITTADISETPVAYLPGNAMRLTVKVVGDLAT